MSVIIVRTDVDARRLVVEARHILEVEGWIQNEIANEHGFCLVGALIRTTRLYLIADEVYRDVQTRLHDRICGSPVDWNDAPGRTAEDVIQLLKDVEHDLEAEKS